MHKIFYFQIENIISLSIEPNIKDRGHHSNMKTGFVRVSNSFGGLYGLACETK